MTEQAASQASREGKNCSKKTRSLASIPPTRAALVNNAKRAASCFRMDLSGHKPLLLRGITACRQCLGIPHWTTLQQVNVTCYEVIHCWCKTVCRGRCKCVKGNLACTGLCNCTEQLLLGPSFRNK